MNRKQARQRYILQLIHEKEISTQEQLTAELESRGYRVSQSCLSKDLKELGLVKIPTEEGRFRYILPKESEAKRIKGLLKRGLLDFMVSFDYTRNLLVLKTTPGNAQGLAAALDATGWPEVMATIAGDDTILVICRTEEETRLVVNRIREMVRV